MTFLKKSITQLFIITTIVTLFFVGCDSDDISERTYETQYYRKSQLENIYDNEISSLTSLFIVETSKLNTLASQFNANISLENLELLQSQWVKTLVIWKQIELYDIGDISDSFIYTTVNYWPSNTDFINDFIETEPLINEAFINSKGASSKGFSAIEYLIFNESDPITINSFTVDAYYENRLKYLVSCIQNLHNQAQKIQQSWEDYAPSFTTQLENGTDGSQNEIINAMVALTEEIIIYKLGFPLGDNNAGRIDIDDLEAYRSETSLEIIKYNLMSLERCFTGEFKQTPFRIGFTDYLIQLGYEDLSTTITTQFETCFDAIQNINGPLKQALVSNPENITTLQKEIKSLLVLIKVDMSNAIGSTITFNDNDGD